MSRPDRLNARLRRLEGSARGDLARLDGLAVARVHRAFLADDHDLGTPALAAAVRGAAAGLPRAARLAESLLSPEPPPPRPWPQGDRR